MQTRWMSLVESVTNILVGYGLAILTQIILFPVFGLHASVSDNLLLGGAFTVMSLIRSYALRRLFIAVENPERDLLDRHKHVDAIEHSHTS